MHDRRGCRQRPSPPNPQSPAERLGRDTETVTIQRQSDLLTQGNSSYLRELSMEPHRYFIINKPYNMVSQFIGHDTIPMLGKLDFDFPEGIHAVGRLDSNSEGLLILTTNKKVTNLLFNSGTPHKRTYLVRVKDIVNAERLEELRTGVTIVIKDGALYTTPPCEVDIIENPPNLFPHQRELRAFVPHTWLQISLYEGKYHQVRKMCSAVNHRCLRLIRTSIEDLELGTLAPGAVKELGEEEFFKLLRIER